MSASTFKNELRKLHKLLAARAFLRAALLNAELAKAFIDSDVDDGMMKGDLHVATRLLEGVIQRIESCIGSMIYDIVEEENESVKKVIASVVFGEGR